MWGHYLMRRGGGCATVREQKGQRLKTEKPQERLGKSVDSGHSTDEEGARLSHFTLMHDTVPGPPRGPTQTCGMDESTLAEAEKL